MTAPREMTAAEADLVEKVLSGYRDVEEQRTAVAHERLLAKYGSESNAIERLQELASALNSMSVEYRELHDRCRMAGLDAALAAADLRYR